ncbi:MAG: hypothetical protein ABIK53_09440 [bacterium]
MRNVRVSFALAISCVLMLCASQARGEESRKGAVNLVPNPSFEQPAKETEEKALGWGVYQCGYERSKDKSYAPDISGPWSCKISGSGKEEEKGLGGTNIRIPTGFPEHGTFSATNSIYIASYTQGRIYKAYITVRYTDKTEKGFSSVLSSSEIADNLNRWKTYSITFTTDPEKKIKGIIYWCLVWKQNEEKFIGTVYFDELELRLADERAKAKSPLPSLASIHQQPFFAKKIEVTPGGQLMLHPRLPYVESLPDEEYTLKLNLPKKIKLSPINVAATDINSRINPKEEIVTQATLKKENRNLLFYSPDVLNEAYDGMELHLLYLNKNGKGLAYTPIIKFIGTFDWQTFEKELTIAEGIFGAIPLLLKWPQNPTFSGTLRFRSLQIKEADTGKIIFNFQRKEPIVMKLEKGKQATYWLSEKDSEAGLVSGHGGAQQRIALIPGKKYLIACQAKGEEIKSPSMSVKDILAKKPYYTRTFIFDVDTKITLPDKIFWSIEDKKGKIYREGNIILLKAGQTIKPQKIDTSVWICETCLQRESLAVQKVYLEKFDSWGLNTIEPQMEDIKFEVPVEEADLNIPIAQEAKKLGIRTRAYMHFFYDPKARSYCEKHPEFRAITYKGHKTPDYRVCLTHGLDGGKYDDPPVKIGSGRENPWLGRYYEIVKKSVRLNNLDGVFWDFEIAAAPYRKVRFKPYSSGTYRQVCMCPRCLKAFQDYAGLDHVPTIEECCGPLYEKWVDFKCWQNTRVWRLLRQAARESNPNATFGIYSGPVGDYSRQAYGVDWTMAAPYLDFAMQRVFCPPSPGTAAALNTGLMKGLPENHVPPRILIQLNVFPYSDQWLYGVDANRVYAELCNIKNNIVKLVAVCGSFGWSFTGIWGMDDQLTLPIREANALLAKYEDFFLKGKRADKLVEVKQGNVEIVTWQKRNKLITVIFNRNSFPEDVLLKRPDYPKKAKLKVPGYDCLVQEW